MLVKSAEQQSDGLPDSHSQSELNPGSCLQSAPPGPHSGLLQEAEQLQRRAIQALEISQVMDLHW